MRSTRCRLVVQLLRREGEKLPLRGIGRAAAADVALYQPSPEDVAARVQAFRGRLGEIALAG